jgi:hypothetical protein
MGFWGSSVLAVYPESLKPQKLKTSKPQNFKTSKWTLDIRWS